METYALNFFSSLVQIKEESLSCSSRDSLMPTDVTSGLKRDINKDLSLFRSDN
jgi:hypothetical protein